MLKPDVERLLRRPKIEKPREEFLIPPPPTADLPPVSPVAPAAIGGLAPVPTLSQRLLEEAAAVGELAELVIRTATPLRLPVPEEHQAVLGETLTTADYVNSISQPDAYHPTRQHLFEWGVLRGSGCGLNPNWSTLALPDLLGLQQSLTQAVTQVEGTLIPAPTPRPLPPTAESAAALVHEELLTGSREYRLKFGHVTKAMRADAAGDLVSHALSPALGLALTEARPVIREAKRVLSLLRTVLCHTQLLLAFEHVQVRELFIGLVKQAVVEQLLEMLNRLLAKTVTTLVHPVVAFLEGNDGGGLAGQVRDGVSQAMVGMVGATCGALQQQYLDLSADLVREVQQRNRMRLAKLQVLGEHVIVGRWVDHLGQLIQELDQLAAAPAPDLARSLTRVIASRLPAPQSVLHQAFTQDDRYLSTDVPFPVRQQPFTGGAPDLSPVPRYGAPGVAGPTFGPDLQPQNGPLA